MAFKRSLRAAEVFNDLSGCKLDGRMFCITGGLVAQFSQALPTCYSSVLRISKGRVHHTIGFSLDSLYATISCGHCIYGVPIIKKGSGEFKTGEVLGQSSLENRR